MMRYGTTAFLPFAVLAVGLSACTQADRTPDMKPAASGSTHSRAAAPGESLVVTDLAKRGKGSSGTEVYVRVVQDGKDLAPVGDSPAGWVSKGGGVWLRVVPEGSAPQSIEWSVTAPDKTQLYFSNTAYSGQVKVSWRGKDKTYDLYSPLGAAPRGPLTLGAELPPAY